MCTEDKNVAQVTGTALSVGQTTLLAVASASSVGGQGVFPPSGQTLALIRMLKYLASA